MPKYKIYWCEYHNPLNWGKTFELGVKKIKSILPKGSDIHLDPNENDGWVECECEDFFTAKDIKEAKQKVETDYSGCYQEIFTVFEKTKEGVWEKLFTEEDMEEDEKMKEYIKKEKEKDKKYDEEMKVQGFKFKVELWVHSEKGRDYPMHFYFHKEPTKDHITKLAMRRRSVLLTDFTVNKL